MLYRCDSADSENGSCSGCILKPEPRGVAVGLDLVMKSGRKKSLE